LWGRSCSWGVVAIRRRSATAHDDRQSRRFERDERAWKAASTNRDRKCRTRALRNGKTESRNSVQRREGRP
jgi:hypothetical protein